jgi:hypothetical protein
VKKRKKVVFKTRLKDYSTEDFWAAIKTEVQLATKTSIEQYRDLVLNTFSHYNTERHEIRTELENAIAVVKNLKAELNGL